MLVCGEKGSAVALSPARGEEGERRSRHPGVPSNDPANGLGGPSSEQALLTTPSAGGEDAHASSRAAFIARAVVATGACTAGGALVAGFPRLAASAPSDAQDRKILNFALLLEYIEAGFYAQAHAKGKLSGELRAYVSAVRGHERAHVAFLERALGSNARKKPTLDFGDTISNPRKFTAAAIELEENVIAAYNGQAANLTKPTLAAAAKIVSVEARHAAWIRAIAGQDPAPTATDRPKTAAEVQAFVTRTGFVQSS
jgi:rubrerythrin